jgi:hypothetical protein
MMGYNREGTWCFCLLTPVIVLQVVMIVTALVTGDLDGEARNDGA